MKNETLLPRREFLAHVSGLGALALTGTSKFCSASEVRPDTLSHADFARHVGSTFQLYPETGGPVMVRLLKADALRAAGSRPRTRSPFALIFDSPVACQSICRLEHAQLGRLALFLSPVGQPATGVRLQAVFG